MTSAFANTQRRFGPAEAEITMGKADKISKVARAELLRTLERSCRLVALLVSKQGFSQPCQLPGIPRVRLRGFHVPTIV